MIDMCRDCPNIKCKELCREAKWYSDQGQDTWRRGEQRKLIFLDMDIFPDKNWIDGFGEVTINMQTVVNKLTLRQQKVLMSVVGNHPKTKIEEELNISRWSLNHAIRKIKTVIEESYNEI